MKKAELNSTVRLDRFRVGTVGGREVEINDDNQILILGGGFAGLFTALHLEALGCPLPIKLIDREARFTFKPLLYELLSDEVQVDGVWPLYEELLGDCTATYVCGNVQSIDLQNQRVELESGVSHGYRYLVIALGDTVGYFDVSGAREHTFTFRTVADALNLGQQLQHKLQAAVRTEDTEQRRALLTTAIVGAGPSGVELAATLADLLPARYEELGGNAEAIRIVVFQRSSDILPGWVSQDVHKIARTALDERQVPVQLCLNATVKAIQPGSLTYQQADEDDALAAETIIWTAGSATHPLVRKLPVPEVHCDERGRPYLTSALQLIGMPNVFAGGDCAVDVRAPQPATAQVAYQQGRAIARNIQALIEDRSLEPTDITIRGTLMKLGLEEGVAEILNKVQIAGRTGHLIRQALYRGLLPMPAKNLKLGVEWIASEVFEKQGL